MMLSRQESTSNEYVPALNFQTIPTDAAPPLHFLSLQEILLTKFTKHLCSWYKSGFINILSMLLTSSVGLEIVFKFPESQVPYPSK